MAGSKQIWICDDDGFCFFISVTHLFHDFLHFALKDAIDDRQCKHTNTLIMPYAAENKGMPVVFESKKVDIHASVVFFIVGSHFLIHEELANRLALFLNFKFGDFAFHWMIVNIVVLDQLEDILIISEVD